MCASYRPAVGDEICFRKALGFVPPLVYRVEAVDSEYVNVSVEDAITPSGERFYYDLTLADFRDLGPVPSAAVSDVSADHGSDVGRWETDGGNGDVSRSVVRRRAATDAG